MIYFYRTAQSDYEKSVYERDCTSICKKLIYQKDTTLLLTPKTGKRYIKNEDSSVFIILDSHRVKIINHVYAYDVHFTEKGWNQLIDIFDTEVEKRREEFEIQITSNIKSSLKKILSDIQ
jgi:hypothetical protein